MPASYHGVMRRYLHSAVLLAGTGLMAFGQQVPTPPEAVPPTDKPLSVTIRQVLAPTIVVDRDGSFIDGLGPTDFRLFDNGQLQSGLQVQATSQPISMVVAIQANGAMTGVLPKLRHIGAMLENQVLGENGEAAILAYDHRQRVIQDFTHDSTAFNRAMETLNAGSSTSAMIDAVQASIRMLNKRPRENRKIILLIGEVRDGGSQAKAREVLTNAEFGSVTVYTVSVSRLTTELTGERTPQRTSVIPPAASMGTLPPGSPPTPLAMEQIKGINPDSGTSINFKPLVQDIIIGTKKIFVDAPADVFTTYTGGRKFDFYREKGLDKALEALSSELHREYILSYTPANTEGGYHEIVVQVSRPKLTVRTRPGYWYGGEPQP